MASSISLTPAFSSRPSYDLFLYVRRDRTDAANNQSSYAWQLQARWHSGSPRAYESSAQPWSVQVGNQTFNGTGVLDFRSTDVIGLGSDTTRYFGHDAAGNLNITVAVNMTSPNFGRAYADAIFATDGIPRTPPGTPKSPGVSLIKAQSMRISSDQPANNGQPITKYAFAYGRTSALNPADAIVENAGYIHDISGLIPGTMYYIKTRAYNAAGWGPWSPAGNAPTKTALRYDDGTGWKYWVVDRDDGVNWVRQEILYDDGAAWKKAT